MYVCPKKKRSAFQSLGVAHGRFNICIYIYIHTYIHVYIRVHMYTPQKKRGHPSIACCGAWWSQFVYTYIYI